MTQAEENGRYMDSFATYREQNKCLILSEGNVSGQDKREKHNKAEKTYPIAPQTCR